MKPSTYSEVLVDQLNRLNDREVEIRLVSQFESRTIVEERRRICKWLDDEYVKMQRSTGNPGAMLASILNHVKRGIEARPVGE